MKSNKSISRLIFGSILVSTISNGFVSGMEQILFGASTQRSFGIPTQRELSSKTPWDIRPMQGYVQQPSK